jgi:Cft2 family RNA processing exonuclease
MFLTNLTRFNEIGANSYLLDTGSARVLLDSGMHPKREGRDALPDLAALAGLDLDAMVITHAHHDHIGSLPLAQRQCPGAEVYMTELTALLADAMLHNSVNVMSSQREELGLKEYPLFTHGEVEEVVEKWRRLRTRRKIDIGPGTTLEFFDAGHIPGSAGAMIRADGKSLFYTGDVQFEDQSFCLAADFPREPVDVLIMETTRGAAARAMHYTRSTEIERFASVARRAFERGGAVLIPVFALGKTQEFLLLLHQCREQGLLPYDTPVHLGGLGTKLTTIIDRFTGPLRRQSKGFQLLRDTGVRLPNRKHRGPIEAIPGHIYALSSGMMTENTTSNVFARDFIDNPRNAICFVGYADPDSVAGGILAAKPDDHIVLDRRWPPVPLRAEVSRFDFSGHATRDDLRAFARDVRPKKIVLVHGDPDALEWFQAALAKDLPGTRILIPKPGVPIDIS